MQPTPSKGEALYPFGYGLSYTTFKYSKIVTTKNNKKGKPVTITARVTNTGKKDGEEVVQCYVSHTASDIKKPIRALKGFQRIHLKAGESRKITFVLTPEDLSIVNESGQLYQPSGGIEITIGGGQQSKQPINSQNGVLTFIDIYN